LSKMLTKEQFKKLMQSLKSIESKLDVLVAIHRASAPKPKTTPAEKVILKLCDNKHTIDDIIKESGKTRTNVESLLSKLRKKGQIMSVKVKGKRVYKRI